MPTIEIVSLERKLPLKIHQKKYPFRVWQNTTLNSHRSLFQDFLKGKKGVILHLANLECQKTGFWFASTLIDHDFEDSSNSDNAVRFRFNEKSCDAIKDLLNRAFRLSPVKRAYLLTDYQFGERPKNLIVNTNIEDFWLLHEKNGLFWNTLYELTI